MIGNLARATYVGSSDWMWPWSYNNCNERFRTSQEINACSKVNHYGMAPQQGRGAPEIDVIEAMQGDPEELPSTNISRPYQSASLQIAPGLEHDRPTLGLKPRKVNSDALDSRIASGVNLIISIFVNRDTGTVVWNTPLGI